MIFFCDLTISPHLYYQNENKLFIGYSNYFDKHI